MQAKHKTIKLLEQAADVSASLQGMFAPALFCSVRAHLAMFNNEIILHAGDITAAIASKQRDTVPADFARAR